MEGYLLGKAEKVGRDVKDKLRPLKPELNIDLKWIIGKDINELTMETPQDKTRKYLNTERRVWFYSINENDFKYLNIPRKNKLKYYKMELGKWTFSLKSDKIWVIFYWIDDKHKHHHCYCKKYEWIEDEPYKWQESRAQIRHDLTKGIPIVPCFDCLFREFWLNNNNNLFEGVEQAGGEAPAETPNGVDGGGD